MTAPTGVRYEAPCPSCHRVCTWHQTPAQPFPTPRLPLR